MVLQGLTILGEPARSTLEYYVANALIRYKWKFSYQVPVFGGRALRGGQVIDFLVSTVPLPTPIFVQGSYWHGDKRAETDRLNLLLLQSRMQGVYATPVVWFEDDVIDQETTNETVLAEFGRAQ